MFLPRFPRLASALVLLVVILGGAGAARAQADGFTVQERAGLAMVKPQPWSKDNEATVMEFLAYTDRTVKGTPGAGYYEFRTKAADKRQVPASRITKLIVYPDPRQFVEILEPKDRESVVAAIAEMQGIATQYPAAKTYLQPSIKAVSAELALFDSGKVKINGEWIARDAYFRDQAGKLAASMKEDIEKSGPNAVDPKTDTRYLELQKLANSNAGAKTLLAEIADLYAKKTRIQQRNALLARMADPALTMTDAQGLVKQLKDLQPNEDSRATALLKTWETSKAFTDGAAADGAKLAASVEGEMKGVTSEDTPPQLSPDLDKAVTELTDKTNLFIATKPLPPFVTDLRQTLAVCNTGTGLKKLKSLFTEKQFLTAKDVLDDLSRQAHNVGPETKRVVTALQRTAAGQIEEFTRVREEAKNLDSAGKPAEALVKYEAAFAVIPDEGVKEEITRLTAAKAAASPAKK